MEKLAKSINPLVFLAQKIPMRVFGPPVSYYESLDNTDIAHAIIIEVGGEVLDAKRLLQALNEQGIDCPKIKVSRTRIQNDAGLIEMGDSVMSVDFIGETRNPTICVHGSRDKILEVINAIKMAGRQYVEIPGEKYDIFDTAIKSVTDVIGKDPLRDDFVIQA